MNHRIVRKGKRIGVTVLCLLLSAFLFAGCVPAEPPYTEEDMELVQLEPPKEGQDIAIFETNYGTIKMMLFTEETPQTVAHFKTLIEAGFYDGRKIVTVDRTAGTIHTGEDETTDTHGRVMTENGKDVPIEVHQNLWHFSGAVSAYQEVSGLNSRYTDSDSRFFIIGTKPADESVITQMKETDYPDKLIEAYREMGGLIQYSGCFTVFAQVYEGLEVVDDILTNAELEEDSVKPAEDLYIVKAELSTYTKE